VSNPCRSIQQLFEGEVRVVYNAEQEDHLVNVEIPEIDNFMRNLVIRDKDTSSSSHHREAMVICSDPVIQSATETPVQREEIVRIRRNPESENEIPTSGNHGGIKTAHGWKFLVKESTTLSGGVQQKFRNQNVPFKTENRPWRLTNTFRRYGIIQCFKCSKFGHPAKYCHTPPAERRPILVSCTKCHFVNLPGETRTHAFGCINATKQ